MSFYFKYKISGMKITVGHRLKSKHAARLAAHYTRQSVTWPDEKYACVSVKYACVSVFP